MPIFRTFNCICTASCTVTLYERPYVTQVQRNLLTSVKYGRSQGVTVPDAVHIQFNLLKMSILMLESCRGLSPRGRNTPSLKGEEVLHLMYNRGHALLFLSLAIWAAEARTRDSCRKELECTTIIDAACNKHNNKQYIVNKSTSRKKLNRKNTYTRPASVSTNTVDQYYTHFPQNQFASAKETGLLTTCAWLRYNIT